MSSSFWEIVGRAKEEAGDDWESRPDTLKSLLLKLTPEEICQFDLDYHKKLIEAYRWDLWGAAYLINGGCSDDGFDYFRDFLISEGRQVYEAALKNPDSLAELGDLEDAELESYRYVIYEAYEELTGKEMPFADIDYPDDPAGHSWEEDDLEKMFPKLAAKYG